MKFDDAEIFASFAEATGFHPAVAGPVWRPYTQDADYQFLTVLANRQSKRAWEKRKRKEDPVWAAERNRKMVVRLRKWEAANPERAKAGRKRRNARITERRRKQRNANRSDV